MKNKKLLFLIIFLFMIQNCNNDGSMSVSRITPIPNSTDTPIPTASSDPTPIVTTTSNPIAAPSSTATITSNPTATPSSTSSSAATATPTSTPTPIATTVSSNSLVKYSFPPDQAANVSPEFIEVNPIKIVFTEAMDINSLIADIFTLENEEGLVTGNVKYLALSGEYSITFTPLSRLNNNKIYTARLGKKAKSISGKEIGNDFSFVFSTLFWDWLNPQPQGNNINSLWMDASSLYAAGNNGTILHYLIEQAKWKILFSGERGNLFGLWGPSYNNLYAVGEKGLILHYDGFTWKKVFQDNTEDLFGIWGSSASNIFAVGARGTILNFNGSVWKLISTPLKNDVTLYGIWGKDANNIYIAGSQGTILQFSSSSWTLVENSEKVTDNLFSVWGKGTNIYFSGANGIILKYNTDISIINKMSSGTNQNIYALNGLSENKIIAVGEKGTVLSYDGNKENKWEKVDTSEPGINKDLRVVSSGNNNFYFLAGQSGLVFKYDEPDWKYLSSGVTINMGAIWGVSKDKFFITGEGGKILESERLTINTSTAIENLNGIWGFEDDTKNISAYAAGDSGAMLRYNGVSWEKLNIPVTTNLRAVWGSSQENVYAVGDQGTIINCKGINCGPLSLEDFSGKDSDFKGIWGVKNTEVYVAGSSGTVILYDGFKWKNLNSPTTKTFNSVWGNSANDIYLVGEQGIFFHYDSYRGTWTDLSSNLNTAENLTDVWSSTNEVYIVGEKGIIFKYISSTEKTIKMGGFTNQQLTGVWGTDNNNIFISGEGGLLLGKVN